MNTTFAHGRNPRSQVSRRSFLKSAGVTAALASTTQFVAPHVSAAQAPAAAPASPPRGRETYDTHAKGIRIVPSQWRPHYPWEHIVWMSPSWPSQDYLWLDFPEAIFSDQGLLGLRSTNEASSLSVGGNYGNRKRHAKTFAGRITDEDRVI